MHNQSKKERSPEPRNYIFTIDNTSTRDQTLYQKDFANPQSTQKVTPRLRTPVCRLYV